MRFGTVAAIGFLLMLIHLPISANSSSGDYGEVTVKKWAGDKKSAFSFTFDDGHRSQEEYAIPILNSFDFKGTFFIISSYIRDNPTEIRNYPTWDELNGAVLKGHEIGSHTVTHPDLSKIPTGDTVTQGTLLYELYQSKKTIEQKIATQKCITLAYPYTHYNTIVIEGAAKYYESARAGKNLSTDFSLTGYGFYKVNGKEEPFNLPRDSTQDDLDELQNFESYIENSIFYGKWGILMGHEIFPFSQIPTRMKTDGGHPMSVEWLTSLCEWLKQKTKTKEVWVETAGNIIRYMKEREHFQYSISAQTSDHIEIIAKDDLNDNIFNYPLTADIAVPNDWESAIIIQGSRKDTADAYLAGFKTYIRAEIIPDGGMFILNKLIKTPLHAELTSFNAGLRNNIVQLNWTTSSELNNNRFDIERMVDDHTWKSIGSIQGAGNSTSQRVYSFTEKENLSSGRYTYRLKLTDYNGQFEYSKKVEVEVNRVLPYYLLSQNYPNPFNPTTRIRYTLPFDSNVMITVYNALGQSVKQLANEMQHSGIHELTFNGSGNASGIYFYSIEANSLDGGQNFRETKKMIFMK
jgi:peptidoglycan/xylan/chitin deacetylase (PgdA/CDA1 family)